ncbi:MAG: hypothetical protein K1000chlam4_01091 [Chlamydiae bacterium]|nr:hypothetical protein [Chlamydiota bacterium]
MQAVLQAIQTAKPVQGPVAEAAVVAAIHAAKQTGRPHVPGPPIASVVGKLAKTARVTGTAAVNTAQPPKRTLRLPHMLP